MEDVVGAIIKEYLELKVDLIERELKLKEVVGKALSIVGVRRSGKTSLLLYYFQKFRDEGKNVLFFPFDDDRIYPPTLETIRTVVKVAKEFYPEGKIHFFFDEVQEVDNWELAVKRLVEREGHSVFLTGSSSKLLSKEIATQLRGRTITYEIFPFSFREVLKLHNIEVSKYYTESQEAKIRRLLKKYLEWGGFPEIWVKNEFADEILKEYVNIMLYRDLIERFGVRNYKALKLFLKLAVTAFSTRISINKISNYMKTLNIDVSRNTLYNYLEYCNDGYILFPVRRFSYSLKEIEQSKPKIYVIDNGIIRVFAHKISENVGRLMENIVFLELRRKYKENEDIFYYVTKDNKEIDFLIENRQIIEVTYDPDQEHVKKIIRALDELKIKKGLIITWDHEDVLEKDGKTIEIKPLWKWLLVERSS
jgi:predicted AAA+ superfamily ATPase